MKKELLISVISIHRNKDTSKNLLNEAGTYSSELQLTIVQSKSQTKRVSTEGRGLLIFVVASSPTVFASMGGDDSVMIIFQFEDYASPVSSCYDCCRTLHSIS